MNDLEIMLMKIISYSGESRACCLEAIQKFKKGNQKEGEALLKKADENLLIAKKAHKEILQRHAAGEYDTINLLTVHAEDQMMSSETIYYLTRELFSE